MSPRKAPKKSSTEKTNETGSVEHYNAILLEDIKSKMELVIEGMEATRTELKTDMQQMEARLSGDINMLKMAVTAHSGEINGLKTEVNGLKTEVKRLDTKIDQVETRLSDRIDQVETRLSDKIDHQNSRWDNHENRIATLEKAVNA